MLKGSSYSFVREFIHLESVNLNLSSDAMIEAVPGLSSDAKAYGSALSTILPLA